MTVAADDATPRLTGQLFRAGHGTQIGPRSTWQFSDLVYEALSILSSERSPRSSNTELHLFGKFSGPPPVAELSPEIVSRLASAEVALRISLEVEPQTRKPRSAEGKIQSESKLFFTVSGHFDPVSFSSAVGLSPTSMVREGESRIIVPRLSVWSIKRGPFTSREIPRAAINELLLTLAPKDQLIRSTLSRLNVAGSFGMFVDCVDVVPTLRVEATHLAELARLGVSLEYSVSVVREGEDIVEF